METSVAKWLVLFMDPEDGELKAMMFSDDERLNTWCELATMGEGLTIEIYSATENGWCFDNALG